MSIMRSIMQNTMRLVMNGVMDTDSSSPSVVIKGVRMDAGDWISGNQSIAASSEGSCFFWMRAEPDLNTNMWMNDDAWAGSYLVTSNTPYVGIDVYSTLGDEFLIASQNIAPFVGQWVPVFMSWNTNFAAGLKLGQIYIGNSEFLSSADTIDADAAFDIGYTQEPWFIGKGFVPGQDYAGDLAEFWWDDQYIDWSVEANRLKFVSAAGAPVDLGTDGSTPFSTAPNIYLSVRDGDAASAFCTNRGTGGDFTQNGTLTLSTNNPSDNGLIAFWEWTGADNTARLTSKVGDHVLSLGAGSLSFTTSGPGEALVLNGSTYLTIPAASVGDLNIGATYGDACTVFAWIYRTPTASADAIMGIWQEDDADPKRQYCLFCDLTGWDGNERVNGHVSKSGGPTPGYIYSRDTSVNRRQMMPTKWYFIAFTYDGEYSRAYLWSMLDLVPSYTDSEANTYASNPYYFPDGLNTTPADFTVGAVKLTAGMDNFTQGRIGPCGVYRRALSMAELTDVMRATRAINDPVYEFDFYVSVNTNPRGIGWQCASGAAVYTDNGGATPHEYFGGVTTGTGREFLSRLTSSVDVPLVAWSPEMAGVMLSEITSVSFVLNSAITNSLLRLVIKSGDVWYATDATFDMAAPGVSATDWSGAETETFTFDLTAAKWRDLTFVPGSSLSLAGSARSTDLPDGELQNIGFYSPTRGAGSIRIDDLKVFA